MKYILTDAQGGILGPFITAEQIENGYLCDNELYPSTVTGSVVLSEVSDNYLHPNLPIYPEQLPLPKTKQGAV
jgi:hypothetical protein